MLVPQTVSLALRETEKESVERLDDWGVMKGTVRADPAYCERIVRKAEDLVKTNSADILKFMTVKRFPRRRNLAMTPGRPVIKQKTEETDFAQSINSYAMTMREGQRSLADNFESVNMDYEATAAFKYRHLLEKLEKKRALEAGLVSSKTAVLGEIADLKRRIGGIRALDPPAMQTTRQSTKSLAKMTAAVTMERRSEDIRGVKTKIAALRQELDRVETQARDTRAKIAGIKQELTKLREEQSEHYHKLLSQAVDTRQEGVVWIVKAIWGLGRNLNLSRIPRYLDSQAISYLLDVLSLFRHNDW